LIMDHFPVGLSNETRSLTPVDMTSFPSHASESAAGIRGTPRGHGLFFHPFAR
jgi:hypothetical protein